MQTCIFDLSVQSSRETLELENALFFFGGAIKGKKTAATTGTAMRTFGRNGRNGIERGNGRGKE